MRQTPRSPERTAALALALADGVGSATYRNLVARFGSAARAFDAHVSADQRAIQLERVDRALALAEPSGADFMTLDDDTYFARLLDLSDPPAWLFHAGALDTLKDPVVAIVGTRDATPYGERITRELAGALARAGACVISGMARGIDGVAHRAALDAGGRTVAVLGTGVDIAYPASHRSLHAAIAKKGLLLSELLPGDRANAGSFPRRNRIIAALATVTVVVEAGAGSGALITASHALELGRTVAAVPGPIDMPQSTGSNELLRDGAVVIASVADALALIGLTLAPRAPAADRPPSEHAIWTALAKGALDMESLTNASGLPARDCLAAVTALEMSGAIECLMDGAIRRR